MKAEEYIKNYTKTCSNELAGGGWNNGEFIRLFQPWITPEHAMEAVRLAKEDVANTLFAEGYREAIKKACDILSSYDLNISSRGEFIECFENDMREILTIIMNARRFH